MIGNPTMVEPLRRRLHDPHHFCLDFLERRLLLTAEIFVTSLNGGTVGAYTTDGAAINASLVPGLAEPDGIAASGSNLFVVNNGSDSIGEYTTSGATVNASLIPSATLTSAGRIALSGSDLFIIDDTGTSSAIEEFTTAGVQVSASLVPNLARGASFIAVSGSDIFITNITTGKVGEYTTSGATVNANLITGLNSPEGIAVSGSNLRSEEHTSEL